MSSSSSNQQQQPNFKSLTLTEKLEMFVRHHLLYSTVIHDDDASHVQIPIIIFCSGTTATTTRFYLPQRIHSRPIYVVVILPCLTYIICFIPPSHPRIVSEGRFCQVCNFFRQADKEEVWIGHDPNETETRGGNPA